MCGWFLSVIMDLSVLSYLWVFCGLMLGNVRGVVM